MDSNVFGLVASIVGAASALLGAHLNGRMQERRTRADHLQQLRLEDEKRRHSHGNTALQELKDARLSLCRVRREASMTMSFVTCEDAMTPQAYNQRYLDLVTDLDKIEVAIDCWAPELQKELARFRGAHSCFWGEQQHLLHLRGSSSEAMPGGIPHSRAVQEARDKIALIVRDADAAASAIRRGLQEAHLALLGLPPASLFQNLLERADGMARTCSECVRAER